MVQRPIGFAPVHLRPHPRMVTCARPSGYTLVEILLTLALGGVLCAAAVPSLRAQLEVQRGRSALNRMIGDLHLARMLAVREGGTVELILQAGGSGCISSYQIRRAGTFEVLRHVPLQLDGADLCVRATGGPGGSTLRFNSRGMLLPPARSLYVHREGSRDTIRLATSGRMRRTY